MGWHGAGQGVQQCQPAILFHYMLGECMSVVLGVWRCGAAQELCSVPSSWDSPVPAVPLGSGKCQPCWEASGMSDGHSDSWD